MRTMRIRLALVCIAAACAASTAPRAQTRGFDVYFGALKWRSIGPLRGGRSITAAGSAKRPLE